MRLVRLFPDPGAPAPRRPAWRVVLDAIAGKDSREAPSALLLRPFGVAAAEDGTLFVADPDAAAVVRVDPEGGARRVECRSARWSSPMGVALGPEGSVYVADAGRAVVVRIAPGGECAILGEGAFDRPTGLAVGADRLYVVDPPRHEIGVLSAGGEVVARWGRRGEGDGELHFPTALALAPDGSLLVVDALNFRIARFSREGRWLGAFGKAGGRGPDFERPKAVAADAAGRIYVSDAQRDLVLVHLPDGSFDYALGATGGEPGRLTLPAGVAVAGGRIYVADSHNHRVQVFEIL